jgi:hypothetical protein
MPNSVIKESICTSDTIDQLTWFEEVFFTRLLVNCDDFGRMDARPAILRAKLFPLKAITDKQISEAINKLSTVGIVAVYEYDGRPYLQFVTWDKHQSVRNRRSRYPAANGSMELSASENTQLIEVGNTCMQLNAIDFNCASNTIQSNTNTNTNTNTNPNAIARRARIDGVDDNDAFDAFWKAYPRKVAKAAAIKAWKKINPVWLPQILEALERQRQSPQWLKDGGQYIPHPATWLNQRRWEDELAPSAGTDAAGEPKPVKKPLSGHIEIRYDEWGNESKVFIRDDDG